ncbi:MAG: hypothetical protein R3F19_28550 [Verrucomicrobiales bacterium]
MSLVASRWFVLIREEIVANKPEQIKLVTHYLQQNVDNFAGIIVEDYGKGFVCQQLVDAIVEITKEAGLVTPADSKPSNPL